MLVAAAGLAAVGGWWFVEARGRSDPVTRTAIGPDSIVMLGDSITAGTDWSARFPDTAIANEGHPGFTTRQLVPVARAVAEHEPALVLVLTGTNDVRDGLPPADTVEALTELLDELARRSPSTRVVLQTILPRAETAEAIVATNRAISDLAMDRGLELVDLHAAFDDGSGGLRPDETIDGWHLSTRGYDRWEALLAAVLDR